MHCWPFHLPWLWPTWVNITCTISCQCEYSTGHGSIYISAVYKLFQSLLWISREHHGSLFLDDVTWALSQSFHGLKKCMRGVSDIKYANPKCSSQAFSCFPLCVCVCAEVGQNFEVLFFLSEEQSVQGSYVKSCQILFFSG